MESFFYWTWCLLRLNFLVRVARAFSWLAVRPCYNACTHTNQDGKFLALEPLIALYIAERRVAVTAWHDWRTHGHGPESKYPRGWFGVDWFI